MKAEQEKFLFDKTLSLMQANDIPVCQVVDYAEQLYEVEDERHSVSLYYFVTRVIQESKAGHFGSFTNQKHVIQDINEELKDLT